MTAAEIKDGRESLLDDALCDRLMHIGRWLPRPDTSRIIVIVEGDWRPRHARMMPVPCDTRSL